ncbi:hypothetical protein BH09VER1_BH09VER1_52710 [soil metagenome]
MKKLIFAIFVAVSPAIAQEASPTPTPVQGRAATWQAVLQGGTYAVRVSYMTSVSMHEYVVDGAARVTEVNIGTVGSDLVRFYYIEPNVPKAPGGVGQSVINEVQDKINEGSARAGLDDAWQKVVKNYPTTTHAHTVEYRIGNKDTLQKLFDSAMKSFTSATPGVFKP